jgi:hypothetical protein
MALQPPIATGPEAQFSSALGGPGADPGRLTEVHPDCTKRRGAYASTRRRRL